MSAAGRSALVALAPHADVSVSSVTRAAAGSVRMVIGRIMRRKRSPGALAVMTALQTLSITWRGSVAVTKARLCRSRTSVLADERHRVDAFSMPEDEVPARPDDAAGVPVPVVIRVPLGGPATWPEREDVEQDYPTVAAAEFRKALAWVGGDWEKVGTEMLRLRAEQRESAQADLPRWHPDRF